jgi:hypothetical protein
MPSINADLQTPGKLQQCPYLDGTCLDRLQADVLQIRRVGRVCSRAQAGSGVHGRWPVMLAGGVPL